MNNNKFGIKNLTKGKLPRLPFKRAKELILGKDYDLSLVFTDNNLTKKLNKIYRDKDKPANVLSFALENYAGEIFINLTQAKTNAKLVLLLIHALLHLKGWQHSSKMESEERKFLSLIFHYVPPNLKRYRHRQSPNESNDHRNNRRRSFTAYYRYRRG
ncbi:MAG TPA: rRNA maturation RNase YbeY [Candidatus Paceibacterota bacterium]